MGNGNLVYYLSLTSNLAMYRLSLKRHKLSVIATAVTMSDELVKHGNGGPKFLTTTTCQNDNDSQY